MKLSKPIELSRDLVKKITAQFPSQIYKTSSTLFYEGQIPISAFLIVDGSIQISKKKKFKKLLSSGALLGLSDLFNKNPSSISAEVFPNTEVCFLDRTTILELCTKVDTELATLMRELLEMQA